MNSSQIFIHHDLTTT